MQEFQNAHFERGQVRPDFAISEAARRIAGALDLPADRVAAVMVSNASVNGFDLRRFDSMRGDHLEILRLVFHGECLADVALKIRRELNPHATESAVRQVRDKYFAAFKAAVHAGRISATLSATSLQPVGRDDFKGTKTASARARPQPQVAENIPCRNRVADPSATFGQPVSHLQPPSVSHPAESSATVPIVWSIRPDFSHPSAGQIGHRPAMAGQSATQPAGTGR